ALSRRCGLPGDHEYADLMALRQRLGAMLRSIPPAPQAGIAVALVILVLASFMFFRWVTTPSYTVLYSELEATQVQTVIDELESQGASYRLEAAGTRALGSEER